MQPRESTSASRRRDAVAPLGRGTARVAHARLAAVAVVAGALAGCAGGADSFLVLDEVAPGDFITVTLRFENHSGEPASLIYFEDARGSQGGGQRIDPCRVDVREYVLTAPFTVFAAPGPLEEFERVTSAEEADAAGLSKVLDSEALPPRGMEGYRIAIGTDGRVAAPEPLSSRGPIGAVC